VAILVQKGLKQPGSWVVALIDDEMRKLRARQAVCGPSSPPKWAPVMTTWWT